MSQAGVGVKAHFDRWHTTVATHMTKRVCEILFCFLHVSNPDPIGGSILNTVKPSRQPGAGRRPQVQLLHGFTGDLCNLWIKRLYCPLI